MAGETLITVVGNLVDDPELRFTPSGAAVANFPSPRRRGPSTSRPTSGRTATRCSSTARCGGRPRRTSPSRCRRACGSSSQGRLKARSYETREGEKRTVFELDVDEVGPSLKYATAKVTRVQRSGGGGGYGGGYGGGDDPWATSPAARAVAAGPGRAVSPLPAHGGGAWGGQQGGQAAPRRPAGERPLGEPGAPTSPRSDRPFQTCSDIHQTQTSQPFRSHEPGSRRSTTMAKAVHSQAQEEGLPVLQGEGVLRRLQGHQPAAQVHLRPRQDPRASGDRQLRAAPARRRHGREERP